ncbi:MAG: type II CAAX prenyl endopeptidase Rce1 family protein [Candidatus Roizmanbacteria bacterium]
MEARKKGMKNHPSSIQRMLNVWAIILIVWSIYRTKLQLPEWFDEFIAKPMVFILPVYWYINKYEKGNFLQNIGLSKKNLSKNLVFGLLIGMAFAGAGLASNYVKHHGFDFTGTLLAGSPSSLIYILLLALATAITEEIVSRGFVLKRLYEDAKNIYSASFLSSILFLILHIPILFTKPDLSGSLILLFLGTDLLLSLITSLLFLESNNLLAAILVHALYNIAIILYI